MTSVLEPVFERRFFFDSYANRKGKGTHKALDRCQEFARESQFYLKLDLVKYFPSIDHELLLRELARVFRPGPFLDLMAILVKSGAGVGYQIEGEWVLPGEEPSTRRPRGLPVGNLTSQWLANFFLNSIDHFVKRELGITRYVRFMDDLVLQADDRDLLLVAKEALRERLHAKRLRLHEDRSGVHPVRAGIPFLGMRVFTSHRVLLPGRARRAAKRIRGARRLLERGAITAAEFAHSVRSWVAHASHANSFALRKRVLCELPLTKKSGRTEDAQNA